ncbi:MAG: hypothetical protein WCK84_01750 [Bacteroidota bacterium]
MKIKVSVCILLFFINITGFAIGEHIPAGGRSSAMGGTSVAISDFWSISNNQAGAAWLKGGSAGLYVENHFILKELMYQQIGLALSLKAGTFGLIINRFGNTRYNEIKAGLSYSRMFGMHFSMGVQIDYLRINIKDEYGAKNLLSFEIGLMYKANQRLNIGVHLLNPVPVKITAYPKEQLPTIITIGLSYQFSDTFIATIEAEKDLEHKPLLRAGAEYRFARLFYARLGISTNPMSFTFGFGLEFARIKMDIASEYHQVLGFSPSVSIVYSISKK